MEPNSIAIFPFFLPIVIFTGAPSYGKPIMEYAPDCKGAEAYSNFTKEVIENG